jgi:uncharacterized repeat protein (TIGR04052 family)
MPVGDTYKINAIARSIIALAACSAGIMGCGTDDNEADDGMMTLVIPFEAKAGAQDVACGTELSGVGSAGATVKLQDFLFFVSEARLVREGGEEVPLDLVDDQQWQAQGVTLMDFNDGSGACAGDAATNRRIVARVPRHEDYRGLRFTIGLPPSLNHLDAATAEAPFNKPSTWWSWKGGYKFFQMALETEAHKPFYVHLGSTKCDGGPTTGFSCNAHHRMPIELVGFVPGEDGVRVKVDALLADVDVNAPVDFASGDFIAGCMSFDPDPECDPIFTKLGRRFMDDAAAGPAQVAFEPVAGLGSAAAAPAPPDDTPQPGSVDFVRPEGADMEIVSTRDFGRSHPIGDTLTIGSMKHNRGPGSQCMNCHQAQGPGYGRFAVAGTIYEPDWATPYTGATVDILPVWAGPCAGDDERPHCAGQPVGYYRPEDVLAELPTDPNGNFYTTTLPDGAEPPYWPVVRPDPNDTDLVPKAMGHPAASGSCNMCHGSFKVQLGGSF